MDKEAISLVAGIVAQALELPVDRVQEEDAMETIEEWDSLGHLNILVALDKKFLGKVAKISELSKATSVEKIAEILREHHLI